MDIFTPAFAPFTIALMLMMLIALLELGGLLFGVAFSGLVDGMLPEIDVDADADVDGGDAIGKLFAWLYVGRVPTLIVFATFLAGFGLAGVFIQRTATGVFSAPLPLILAAPTAFAGALPLTRLFAGAVARIFPNEESDAVSDESFIGLIAHVIRGEARKGAPAEAKLADAHGFTHYILVEPESDATFREGAEVLLIEKKGAVFIAVANATPSLSLANAGGMNV